MSGFGVYMKPRGGNRGGTGDFQWSDVKTDKQRDRYLGASLNAPVGRWQNGRDLQWFSKEKKTDAATLARSEQRRVEIDMVKLAEREALAEALGLGSANHALLGGGKHPRAACGSGVAPPCSLRLGAWRLRA